MADALSEQALPGAQLPVGSVGHAHATLAGPLLAGNKLAGSPRLDVVAPSHVAWPEHVFAPLVDIGLTARSGAYPQFDLPHAAQSCGLQFFQLGYVTADHNGEPIVGGYRLDSPWDRGLRAQLAVLRAQGGDVALSFGGADGADRELACVLSDVDDLTAAYRRVIAAYGLRRVDFAIEESAAADKISIVARAQAIARLQRECELAVWFTVAAQPTGLGPEAIGVLAAALQAGVTLAGVNITTTSFAPAATAASATCLADTIVQSATRVCGQLRCLLDPSYERLADSDLWSMLGVTPMVGQNDNRRDVFHPRDARRLLAMAQARGLGLLSYWSLNRDACTGIANYDGTGIAQEPFEFAHIFANFAPRLV